MANRMRIFQTSSMVFLALLVPVGSASASDLSKFLDGLFKQIANRAPSGSELNYYTNLTRNQGPLESAIALYGSDDYYVGRAHRDTNLYVSQLYQDFLRREPRIDERQFWVTQFQRQDVRRVDLIRWFCQTNHITQLPSFLPTPPVFTTPNTAPAIAAELLAKVNLLVNLLNAELGNTYFGNAVVQEARSLLAAAEQYRQVVNDRRSTPRQVAISFSNLEKSLGGLERSYYRVPGSSPQSKSVLQQVSQLVAAARDLNTGWVQQPIAPVPRPPIAAPGLPDASRLVAVTRQFSYGLLSYQNSSPFYANLSRDVQGFSTQIESLSLMIRQGQRGSAMRRSMSSIAEQSRHISQDVSRAGMDIQRGWWNVQSELRPVARALGVSIDFNFQPTRPVIIKRPAWGNFPYQASPGYPANHNQEAITLADQLIGKVDGYTQSLMPVTSYNANSLTLVRHLQNFKHYVLTLRQDAAGGSFTTSLSRSADNLMSQYQQLSKEVARLVSRDSTLNSPLFYQIGELVRKIQYAARGTRQ